MVTLQGINISHLGEKENHLQNAIFGGYVSFLEGNLRLFQHTELEHTPSN